MYSKFAPLSHQPLAKLSIDHSNWEAHKVDSVTNQFMQIINTGLSIGQDIRLTWLMAIFNVLFCKFILILQIQMKLLFHLVAIPFSKPINPARL